MHCQLLPLITLIFNTKISTHTHTQKDRKNSLKVSIIEAPKLAILKNITATTNLSPKILGLAINPQQTS